MSVTNIDNKQADAPKYIELSGGVPFIVDRPVAPDGTSNPLATAENFRRLAPQAAEALREQGAARAKAAASDSDEAKAAIADERARIQAILDHPHAKGRERLAEQLALTPDMDAERAGEILATAPAENPFAAIGSDPGEEARDAADRAIDLARRGGYLR